MKTLLKIFYIVFFFLQRTILTLSNNDIVFSGTVETYLPQRRDIYVVRTDSTLFAKPVNIYENNIILTKDFMLFQNYPNPFNPKTTIRYELPKNEFVKIKVYDIMGRELFRLVNELKQAGSYKLNFDGQNLASGIYIYKIEAGSFIETKRMVLIK